MCDEMREMNAQEIIKMAGDSAVLRVEYRGFDVRSGKLKDGRNYVGVSYRCEAQESGRPVIVSQFLPDGSDASKVVSPFKKGDKLILEVQSLLQEKGVFQARGNLHNGG